MREDCCWNCEERGLKVYVCSSVRHMMGRGLLFVQLWLVVVVVVVENNMLIIVRSLAGPRRGCAVNPMCIAKHLTYSTYRINR